MSTRLYIAVYQTNLSTIKLNPLLQENPQKKQPTGEGGLSTLQKEAKAFCLLYYYFGRS